MVCSIRERSFPLCPPASNKDTCTSRTAVCRSQTCLASERMSRISATNEADIIDAVRDARAKRAPFEIIGAGSKRDYGRPMSCGTLLDTSSLKGIVAYEPEELIITLLPGTPEIGRASCRERV